MKPRPIARLLAAALLAGAVGSAMAGKERPADPFDYNFCGGERVYPVVGVNFSTACGPRNQVALGRRGKLMWLYPGADEASTRRGQVQLDEATLVRLSLLAEVTTVAESAQPVAARVMYKLGINFSARAPKYVHAAYSPAYTPARRLMDELLALVPDKPSLPDCPGYGGVFDPTLTGPARRGAHAARAQLSRNAPE